MRAENGVVLRRTYSPIVGLYPSLSQFYWTAGLAKPPPRRVQLIDETQPTQALARVVSAVAAALSRSGKYTFRIAIRWADVDIGPESGASMRRQCTGHRSLTVTL